jgi:nicotinamide-nucleotide amidase
VDDEVVRHETVMTSSDEPLEVRAGRLLRARGLTIALAESCTGGLIAHRLTNVAGSSDYLLGGVVSYSNAAKEKILGVQPGTLESHGAVSEQTALEMARGAQRLFGSSIAVAVTGVAGPGGGTDAKPVGLTYVGMIAPEHERVERFVWARDRAGNKSESADAALSMVIGWLEAT